MQRRNMVHVEIISWMEQHIKLSSPFKVFICCTAILNTVSLSSLRDMALHIGIIVDNSLMYVFILSLRLFSISLWFGLFVY